MDTFIKITLDNILSKNKETATKELVQFFNIVHKNKHHGIYQDVYSYFKNTPKINSFLFDISNKELKKYWLKYSLNKNITLSDIEKIQFYFSYFSPMEQIKLVNKIKIDLPNYNIETLTENQKFIHPFDIAIKNSKEKPEELLTYIQNIDTLSVSEINRLYNNHNKITSVDLSMEILNAALEPTKHPIFKSFSYSMKLDICMFDVEPEIFHDHLDKILAIKKQLNTVNKHNSSHDEHLATKITHNYYFNFENLRNYADENLNFYNFALSVLLIAAEQMKIGKSNHIISNLNNLFSQDLYYFNEIKTKLNIDFQQNGLLNLIDHLENQLNLTPKDVDAYQHFSFHSKSNYKNSKEKVIPEELLQFGKSSLRKAKLQSELGLKTSSHIKSKI